MIIIKTTNGDVFVNDKAIVELSHDRENKTAAYYTTNGDHNKYRGVECIFYINDAQPTLWQDDGSALEKVRKDNDAQRDIIKRLQQEKQAVIDDLHHFACNMAQLAYNYHAVLPDDVRLQIQKPALTLKSKVLNHGYDTERE